MDINACKPLISISKTRSHAYNRQGLTHSIKILNSHTVYQQYYRITLWLTFLGFHDEYQQYLIALQTTVRLS